MKNIYLAAPFFNEIQTERRNHVLDLLNKNSTVSNIFVPGIKPYEEAEFGSLEWQMATYKDDINHIHTADIVVAILDYDGENSDPGTIWETGYAHALNKPLIVVRFEKSKSLNLMLSMSTTAFFNGEEEVNDLKKYDFEELPIRFSDVDVF